MTAELAASAAAAPSPTAAAVALQPLTARQKLTYACGDVAEGGVNLAIGTFLLFYLTAVCHLSGAMAGLALSLTLLSDSVLDPLIGYLSDNTRSRLGRRHPFLLGAAVPLALMLGLLFNLPPLAPWPLFGWLVAVLLVQKVLQSAFFLSYGALGSELSRDYRERSSITAYRSILNSVGLLIVLSLGYGVFLKGDAALLDRHAYGAYGWTIAAILLGFMLACGLGTLPLRARLQTDHGAEAPSPAAFLRDLRDAFRNRSFVILFATIVVFWVAQGTANVLNLHNLKYFWRAPADLLQVLPLVAIAGSLTGVPLAGLALQRFEKQQVCVGGVILYCVNQSLLPIAHILGLTPEGGLGLYLVLGPLLVLQVWALAAIGVSFFSMLADCADEHEHLFGARREGLFFAGTQFSTKAAIALGSLIGGVALDVIGFPKDLARLGPDPHIDPAVVRNLGLIVGPGAGVVAITCAVILARYSLDARRVAEIQDDLARRRTPS
jgi:GPH family glycoside/pentoside/hexuronide:cation symporter